MVLHVIPVYKFEIIINTCCTKDEVLWVIKEALQHLAAVIQPRRTEASR